MNLLHTNFGSDLSRKGWTLIELIGVLSIIAIAVASTKPAFTRRLDQAARDAEISSLGAISNAFVRASLSGRQFPALANLPQTVANFLNVRTNDIITNKRKLNRVFLADPTMNINGGALPYTQGLGGSTNLPAGGRLMIISSIAKALPTINPSDFNNIWVTANGTLPASLSAWGGRAEDLLIQRIELAPLFHKVVLMNVDPSPSLGRYSIDDNRMVWTNGMPSVAAQSRFAAYYLDGTAVDFYRSDSAFDVPEILLEDSSFSYRNGRWGRRLGGDDDAIVGDFEQVVNEFLQQPVPCDPDSGATQRSVVNAFYDYLWGYADWAFGYPAAVPAVPPFSGSGASSTPQYPAYSVVLTAQEHLGGNQGSFTKNLIQ